MAKDLRVRLEVPAHFDRNPRRGKSQEDGRDSTSDLPPSNTPPSRNKTLAKPKAVYADRVRTIDNHVPRSRNGAEGNDKKISVTLD